MKRTMNEYKASMNKIVPSGSFISETEALMKKIRDEQNGAVSDKKSDVLPIDGQRIDIGSNSRTIKIKKWTMALSAAAAVLICAVSLNVYNRANVDSQMTQDADTQTAESAASAETEFTAETTVSTEETAETTAVTEEELVSFSETEMPEAAAEEITAETEKSPAENNDDQDKQKDNKTENTRSEESSSDFGADAPSDSRGINAANTVDDNAVSVYVENSSDDDMVTTYSPQGYDHFPEIYSDDEYYDEEAADTDTGYGTPVWVPSFIDEDMEEVVEEEDMDVSVDDGYYVVGSSIEGQTSDAAVSSYSLDVSFRSSASGADEVYVPDTISDLDDGEYYISTEAGFDEYDPNSGTFIVSNGAMFDESVVDINSSIVDKIAGLTASKNQYHCDAETKMYDYRYKLTIYSADESENNAKLFEITFKKGELVINRYDNGTVSSEKYTLTSEEYEELDSFIRSLG